MAKTHVTSDIFKKNAKNKRQKNIVLDLYGLSTELFNEFHRLGLIDRLKDIPQLGEISVSKSLRKSRYDYIVLQWWLHKMAHDLVNPSLEYSYGSRINKDDISGIHSFPGGIKPSIEECLQLFILIYNIGHFYSTFIASKAVLLKLKNTSDARTAFANMFVAGTDACETCKKIIDQQDYYHFHLLNSLLVLDTCNQALFSVQTSKRLILDYLNGAISHKESYLFRIFRSIRNLAITTFDLQLAKVPFRINLHNVSSLKIFLNEYLAQYNDNSKAESIVLSLTKLLSDSLYNENNTAVKEYHRVLKTAQKVPNMFITNYYRDYFLDRNSILNMPIKHSISIDSQCLKLTFEKDEEPIAMRLFDKLQHMQFVRSSLYSRHYGQSTIVVTTSKSKLADSKVHYKIFKTIITHLRFITGISDCDLRYLLATKYFLRSIFEDRRIVINATGSSQDCLYCVKGHKNRQRVIERHLLNYKPSPDPLRHEVENLLCVISMDTKNDTAIMIPASILLFAKSEAETKTEIELDGLIIYPYRDTNQIVFLESKISREAGHAEVDLKKKLNKMHITILLENLHITDSDASYEHSI